MIRGMSGAAHLGEPLMVEIYKTKSCRGCLGVCQAESFGCYLLFFSGDPGFYLKLDFLFLGSSVSPQAHSKNALFQNIGEETA